MGLFGLVALAAVRRTKEIGIRKVLGATTGSVLLLMSREFGWLVVVANVIAWPVAYFILNHWLAFYSYRIDIGLVWFVLAGLGVLTVALTTVSGQASAGSESQSGGRVEIRVTQGIYRQHLEK